MVIESLHEFFTSLLDLRDLSWFQLYPPDVVLKIRSLVCGHVVVPSLAVDRQGGLALKMILERSHSMPVNIDLELLVQPLQRLRRLGNQVLIFKNKIP